MTKPTYAILISAERINDQELLQLATAAADDIASKIVDRVGLEKWDVDVIEGTASSPLSGDNVHGLGGRYDSTAE